MTAAKRVILELMAWLAAANTCSNTVTQQLRKVSDTEMNAVKAMRMAHVFKSGRSSSKRRNEKSALQIDVVEVTKKKKPLQRKLMSLKCCWEFAITSMLYNPVVHF